MADEIERYLGHIESSILRERRKRWRAEMGRFTLVRDAISCCMEAGYTNKFVAFGWAILHPGTAAALGRAYHFAEMFDGMIQRQSDGPSKINAIEMAALSTRIKDGELVARTVLLLLMTRYSLHFRDLDPKTLALIGVSGDT